jgi:hypothetical protein
MGTENLIFACHKADAEKELKKEMKAEMRKDFLRGCFDYVESEDDICDHLIRCGWRKQQ